MIGKKILFLCLTFSLCFTINGQTEAEILDQANKYFIDEKFVEATPLYLRLLSLQPKNIDYNYRYGTCLLFNSNKKQESIRYLKYATESGNVEPEAHFYMGRSYHLNYLFNDAVRSYDKFASLAGQKAADKQDVTHLIQMCQDGRRLLMNYSEMVVYEKKEIEADKFFRLYDLKEIGGNLLVTADFQSKIDKKEGHTPLIYFPNSATEIYYSSYGESGDNGKEIYRRVRKSSGGWGEAELVKGKVNTKFDEDFAYRSQDGKYLYFSSKGHNSMGGYDVFRSIYDKATDSFIETENMDFAISSPDDDIFFLVDQNNQNGYFASARQSETGKLFVYKIRIEKLPTQLSIIAGTFESKIKQNSKISVEVQDLATGGIIGKYVSKDDGKILITFPAGGQYKYLMKIEGDSKVFTQNVDIPTKKTIKPLRQNLVHFMENGEEVIRVLDRFDETVQEKDDILAALFSDKAQLDPNSQYFDLDKLDIQNKQKKILSSIGATDLTLFEVAADLANNAKSIKDVEKQSVNFEQKSTAQLEIEMKNLKNLDDQIVKNAAAYRSSSENSMSRQDLLLESKKLVEQRIETKDRLEDILLANQKVQENLIYYKDLKNRVADWEEKSTQITKLLVEDKYAEALQYIEDNKVVIKSGMTDHVDSYHAKTSKEISDYNVEITDLGRKKYNYETSAKDLQNNIDFLERKLFEGNSKDKEETKEKIALKKADFNVIKEEINSIGKEIDTKRKIKEDLVDELAEFMAIENTTTPKTIASYQNAKDKWEQMKNVPMTADYELLAQAIKKSENNDIASNTKSEIVPIKSSDDLYQEINPNYKKTIAEITNNSNFSEAYKAETLIKAEKENQAAIKSAIAENASLLNQNPNNSAIQKNQETLKALLEVSNSDLATYSNKYEEEKALVIANALTEATIVQSVDKTYKEIFDYLNNDIVADQKAKLISLNEHDKKFLKKVDSRIKEVNGLMKTEPAKQAILKKELSLLSDLKTNKESELARREDAIADLTNQLALTNNNQQGSTESNTTKENPSDANNLPNNTKAKFVDLSSDEQEENMLSSVNSKYAAKKEQIENSSISNKEKIQLLTELNNTVLAEIKSKKKSLNKKTQSSEIAALDRLTVDLSEDTKQIEVNLLASYEEPERIVNRLSENYLAEIQSLNENGNLNPIEKEERKNSLNDNLVSALKKEKENFEKLAQANPSNEKIVAKIESIDRLESEYAQILAASERKLNELKSDLASNLTENVEIQENNNFSSLNDADQEAFILTNINSSYKADKKKIEQSKVSELAKTNQLIALDKALLNSLDVEKENLNALNDQSQIAAITRLMDKTNSLITSNQNQVNDLEALALANSNQTNPTNTPQSTFQKLSLDQQEKTIVNQVLPNYLTNKASLEQSIDNEKTKYSNLLALENDLANKLAGEKEKLNKVTDAAKVDAIMRVERELNKSIAENQLNLLAADETPEELNTRLAKDYLKNKQQLASNPNLTDLEKAKRQLAVDQLLLESLEKEKDKFSNLARANPQNEKLKEKENFIFDQIAAKQNEMSQLSEVLNSVAVNNTNVPVSYKSEEITSTSDLRKKLLGETEPKLMNATPNSNSLDVLKVELSQLETYEKNLKKLESDYTASANPSSKETQNQLKIIGAEIKEVEKRKRQYTITIGDLEKELLLAKKQELPKTDNTLEKITKEEKELMAILDGDITSMKEIRKIEKQLGKLSDQKVEHQNELLSDETKEVKKENDEKLEALSAIQTSSVSERVNKELALKRSEQLNQEAITLADLAKKSKNNQESNQLLEKALAKEKQAKEILEIALVDNKVAKLTEGKISTLSTKDELEQRKKSLLLEEAGYNSEIKNVDSEIKANKNFKEEQALLAKRAQLSKERSMVVDQMAFIDKKIGQLPSQPLATIPAERKDIELSFKEEMEISSSLEYKEISKAAKDVLFIENEIAFLLKSIDKDKQAAQKLVEKAVVDGNKIDNANAEAKVKEIQAKEQRLVNLKKDLVVKQGIMAELFPTDLNKKAKIENLVLRGVDPIRTEVSNYIPIPEKGFEIDVNASKTENKELAVDTKVPTGLMFRVQVGAFSKPVAKDAFQEFNPVTGEKRSNGLTVYMAGFFDKSSSATEAQKTIRSLGYSDAFVVAYCDGERIPLVEGRRLESTKECVPMQLQDLTITRTPSPKDTTRLITRELDYNKALGAAQAIPVELKKGLFYTVQIGVYNKPVDPSTIKNLTPLLTKRLPNGQIRYSAGVYVSIEEAMPKRKEAIEKGISDAYITAYYGSERISLGEAERLLQDRGMDIIEKTAIGIVKDVKQRIVAEEKLQKAIVEVEKKRFEEGMGIQLVSKETFNEFPRDMLNRFNKHVSFYFDQNDKHLKSVIYSKIEDIPQIHFLREEVDTVFITDFKLTLNEEKEGYRKIVFYVLKGQLEGDVADFIYRLNYRKEYLEQADNMKVILHNVPSNKIQFISEELRNLKLRSVVE